MLSFFLGRAALRTTLASSSLLKSRVGTAATRPLAARSFLTTSRIQYPAKAKETGSATKATKAKETKATKPTKTAAAAKKGGRRPAAKKAAPKRKPAAKKKAAAKPKKPAKVRITPADKPPKKPAGPYIIFWTRYIASQAEKPKTIQDSSKLAREAARLWREMSEVEKKPFFDEAKVTFEEYYKTREEYFSKVSPEILRELNKRSLKRGGRKLHRFTPKDERKPMSSFFRFLVDFRPQFIQSNEATPGSLTAVTKAAGEKWNSMSDAEKAKYREVSQREYAAWRAKREQKTASTSF